MEGPLKKGSDKSYVVSYRYALTSLNIIPIGTNAIPNYQDLSFKLDLGKWLVASFRFLNWRGRVPSIFLVMKPTKTTSLPTPMRIYTTDLNWPF